MSFSFCVFLFFARFCFDLPFFFFFFFFRVTSSGDLLESYFVVSQFEMEKGTTVKCKNLPRTDRQINRQKL